MQAPLKFSTKQQINDGTAHRRLIIFMSLMSTAENKSLWQYKNNNDIPSEKYVNPKLVVNTIPLPTNSRVKRSTMNKKVVFIPNGEKIYAVPTDVYEKFEITGEKLAEAKELLAENSGDVEGQSYYNSYTPYYDNTRGPSYWTPGLLEGGSWK